MTNYNERPDDLTRFMKSIGWEFDENGYTFEDNYINFRTANILRQNITSLTKELMAGAKPDKHIHHDAYGESFEDAQDIAYNAAIDQFEQNLLKALEETSDE